MMKGNSGYSLLRLVLLLASFASASAAAYDAPWNGGREDITRPGPEPELDCQSGECGCPGENNTSSPVYTARGYLVWRDEDISFATATPIGLTRTWNSFDMRAGLFGRGWVTSQESNIARTYKAVAQVETGDSLGSEAGFESVPVWLASYGRRYTLVETATGCETPAVLDFTFEKTADDGFRQVFENSAAYNIYSERGVLLESYDDREGVTVYYDYDDDGRLVGQSDSHGFQLHFAYNDRGFVSEVTDQADRRWKYSYDEYGNLLQATDPDGNTRDYSYQHIDRTGYRLHLLTDVMDNGNDPALHVTWKQATLYGKKAMRVTSYSLGNGLRHSYSYAQTTHAGSPAVLVTKASSRLDSDTAFEIRKYIADPDSYWILRQQNVTQNTSLSKRYDERGRLIEKSDERGNVTRYEYNPAGQRIRVTERAGTADQREITYQYLGNTDRVTVMNEYGLRETRYSYDTSLRVIQRSIIDLQTGRSRTWTYDYHANTIDARGRPVHGKLASIDGPHPGTEDRLDFTYDGRGQLTRIDLPVGLSLDYEYNPAGQRIRETDLNGVVTDRIFDSHNRIIEESREGRTVRYGYAANGLLKSVEDELGRVTTLGYDRFDQLERITNPSGDYVDFSRDYSSGYTEITRRHFHSDGSLISTRMTRSDNRTGLPRQEYLATTADETRRLRYNGTDDLVEEIHYGYFDGAPGSASTRFGYDAEGRMTEMLGPDGSRVQFSYDEFGRLVTVIDANDGKTGYTRTAFGELVRLASPDTGTTNYGYDDAGRLIRRTNANGQVTTLGYDVLGRVNEIDYPGAENDISLRYDEGLFGKGLLTSVTDGSGTSRYDYDDRGMLRHARSVVAGVSFDIDYAYNRAGELTAITYPGGGQVSLDYDAAGRLNGIHYTENGVSTAVMSDIRWRGSSPGSFRLGNGVESEWFYDAAGRLVERRYGESGDSLQQQLDLQGQIIRQDWTIEATSKTADFHYDTTGRLIFDGQGDWDYLYDPAGNRLRQQKNDLSDDVSYDYESNSNRLTSRGSETIARDAMGNTISDGKRTFQYNSMNRLSQITPVSGSLQASYRYNYKGERVYKQVSGAIELDTRYVYGPDGELLGEYDASGKRIREYVYFRNNGINELIALIEPDGSILHIHTDHLHTPRLATDGEGEVVWRWISDAFGTTSPDTDPDGDGIETVVNHRFPGQYYDIESGLHYNYFRYYDPQIGRYNTSDPIGLHGGLNTFVYVDSSPMRLFDIYGLAIYGELYDSKVLPHELSMDLMEWGMEFDYPIERNKLPGAGPRVAWFDLLVGGKVRFLVHCKETDDCGELINEGYLETSVTIPNIVPYTHHQEVPLIKWMYSIPYNLLRIAMGVDPVLTTIAKANGIPIPLVCEKSSEWMSSLPFSWSDSMPISP